MKLILCLTLIAALRINSFSQLQPEESSTADTVEQRLSLDVKDTDIRDVIRMISRSYNLSILMDQDVRGTVTLHLNDVPVMEGLNRIAQTNGFEIVREGNVYRIQKASIQPRSEISYSDGKLSLDINNMDVNDFLEILSSKANISVVRDSEVDGRVTGKLYQVDLHDGIRAILEGNGFQATRRRNIYQISTIDPASSVQTRPTGINRRGSTGGFFVDYRDGRLSLDVQSGDLEDVISAISEQGDVQIVTYGNIKSEVNAKINDAPLIEALALLLGGTRFTFVQREGVILIGDRNTATPSGQALSMSELIHLNHIKAENIPSILPKDIPATNIRVIKEQNAILVSGTSEDIVTTREFINAIDIPTPQVRIDAVIVEYKDNLNSEVGIRYSTEKDMRDDSYLTLPAPNTRLSDQTEGTELGISGKLMHEILSGINVSKKITDLIDSNFFAALRVLEHQDKAQVLAQPSILTLNGHRASIDVSETQYFRMVSGTAENQTVRFQPIQFGIQLDITPWISQSGQITAEITPVVSNSENVNREGYPNVSSRSMTTTVRLNDGETLVLGGLIKNQETEWQHRVPILGRLPIIGALFRNRGRTRQKSNLVVYITPRIVSRDQMVDLDQELENMSLEQKNFLERQVHHGMDKMRSFFSREESVEEDLQSQEHDTTQDKLPDSLPTQEPEDFPTPLIQTKLDKPENADSLIIQVEESAKQDTE
ncbi:secretin and TonB N-terminal domain-containing protein [Chitinispirillales bacterium ANBcel5]|uniref:secretin and TonB N-terminal domain-containing protein n=1 Tax=Cellulosispirillum alkaliphilum TaxID=3039283 RepID=UPI002A51715A|nr:secretin and TonB N-terminal domain-containing protein [Chitinispirillales bacterium ANBcel5]